MNKYRYNPESESNQMSKDVVSCINQDVWIHGSQRLFSSSRCDFNAAREGCFMLLLFKSRKNYYYQK